jgi:hypothetical protein
MHFAGESCEWLATQEVTAAERLAQLVRWAQARLKPVISERRSAADGPTPPQAAKEENSAGKSNQQQEERDGGDEDADEDEAESESESGGNEDEDEAFAIEKEMEKTATKKKKNNPTKGKVDNNSPAKKAKKERTRIGTESALQAKALRLLSALALTCGKDAHLLAHFDRSTEAARPNRRGTCKLAKPRQQQCKKAAVGNEVSGEASCALIDLLQRIVVTAKQRPKPRDEEVEMVDEDEEQRRGGLRVEAAMTMAVVCFIMEDPAMALEACRFLADCYLPLERTVTASQVKQAWGELDSESESDSDSDDDSGSNEEDEKDDSYDEEDEEDEGVEDEELGSVQLTYEQSYALHAITFLLTFADDADVRQFIAEHRRSLTSLLFNKRTTSGSQSLPLRPTQPPRLY